MAGLEVKMESCQPSLSDVIEFLCARLALRRGSNLVIKRDDFQRAVQTIAEQLGTVGTELTPESLRGLNLLPMSDFRLHKGELYIVFCVAHATSCLPLLNMRLSERDRERLSSMLDEFDESVPTLVVPLPAAVAK